MENENDLIMRFRKGDNNAFKTIVEKYQNYIFAICLNLVKDRFEAENLSQETFLQIYKSKDMLTNCKNFKSWIGKVAVNKSIDWKRKNRYQKGQSDFDDNVLSLNAKDNIIEDKIIDKIAKDEDVSKIKKIIAKIPDKYKRVIMKYYYKNKSYKEISNEENISIKTVESRLYRAKKEIKKLWKEEKPGAL